LLSLRRKMVLRRKNASTTKGKKNTQPVGKRDSFAVTGKRKDSWFRGKKEKESRQRTYTSARDEGGRARHEGGEGGAAERGRENERKKALEAAQSLIKGLTGAGLRENPGLMGRRGAPYAYEQREKARRHNIFS